MNAIEVQNAVKYYRENNKKTFVLNNFNMTVKRGSIFALLGSSGCGKTTLLSCIIGSMSLNSGSIKVQGCSGLKIPGHKIGYMPQQIALIEEFTIKEIIYFFGRICGLTDEKLEDRFQFLKNFLNLPKESRFISNCSGGEQRRVSFAVAILHEPELLILDEPTVGLDPILRSEIWEFLIKSTSTSNLAVIITTHYIDEANEANCIGLMRNGVLLAQDSPSKIIERFQVANLEEAFVKLSTQQENDIAESNESETQLEPTEIYTQINNPLITEERVIFGVNKSTNYGIQMKALINKNLIQMLRHPSGLIFILLLPFFEIFLFYKCVGTDPIGLKLGVVSDEVLSYNDCFNQSLITTNAENFDCSMNQISCRFITQFNDTIAEKVYYHSYQNALNDVKKGIISGIIYFASNFTESLEEIYKNGDIDDSTYDNSRIQIFMDRSDQLITFFLDKKLQQTYKEYSEKLMSDCQFPIKSGNVPINFMDPIYGSYDGKTQDSMAPSTIITFLFFFSSVSAATVFIVDRSTGVWNRSVIAGISSWQFLSSHILTQSLIVVFHFFGCVLAHYFFISTINHGSYILLIVLIIIVQYIGVFTGFVISINSKGFIEASFQLNGLTLTTYLLCGSAWPIEGMPMILRKIAIILPFTLPSAALRDISVKGYTLMHSSVMLGFAVASGWVIFLILLCLILLKSKKFSNNV